MKHYCINLKGLLPDELTLNKGYWKIRQVYRNCARKPIPSLPASAVG